MTSEAKQTLTALLSPATISLNLRGLTKQEIIEELIGLLDRAHLLKSRSLALEAVVERESKLSTGLGHGVAVPHGKTDGVDKLVGAFGIKREGIHFDAADGEPTKMFFMLVSPHTTTGPHIKALAQIAKFLKLESNRQKILNAASAVEVIRIFDSE
jgi:mannitol/fructose-specific phosphotransferase system IIA component (Ntr-type)